MVKHSNHSRLKGCCWVCGHCKGNQRDNVPFRVRRKLGRARRFHKRVRRGDIT